NDIIINYIHLDGAYIKLVRDTQNVWNYQYIVDAFKSQKDNKKEGRLILDLEDIQLTHIDFNMLDQWNGSDMRIVIQSFEVDNMRIDSDKKEIDLSEININELDMDLRKYASAYPMGSFKRKIDNTPFNPQSWGVKVGKIQLKNSDFKTDNELFPYLLGQFDGSHIDIHKINIDVENAYVVNDTIFGHINHVSAVEKSGIQVRDMRGDVKVSPNISEIKNLFLQTNKSTFHHYFAMEYERFPAFLNFIPEVTLVADIRNATIAIEDIGYFAPNMNRWQHEVYYGDFKGRGTIDHLEVESFDLHDDVTSMKGAYSIY